jgi:hypothetical protein
MSKVKFVHLKNNVILVIYIFDDKNIKQEALIAGLRSGARLFEIDSNVPATIGWKYDGVNCISPDGVLWKA